MTPTDEFTALCQSQVNLLTQGFAAEWVAVYLAEDLTENLPVNLRPVVIYPQSQQGWQSGSSLTVLPQMWNQWIAEPPLLATLNAIPEADNPRRSQPALPSASALSLFGRNPLQVVLPLIHQGIVMGLLVAGRHDREWQTRELTQLKNIAETLAIACLLDRKQIWYEQQLLQQRALRHLDRDRIDDLLHQLRNPLTALKTFSKLLLKQLIGDDQGQRVARSILRESDRFQDLLTQYEEEQATPDVAEEPLTLETTLASVAPTALTLETTLASVAPTALTPSSSLVLAEVDLFALLEPILISAEAIAQEKDIRLTSQEIMPLPMVVTHAKALREVLTNLITNAIKYTPNQGEVTVILGLRREAPGQSWIGIEIRDTGYGIPLEDCDRIFERHYRGIQAEGEIPGTGLGLAIVKELVDQMQGKIEVKSPNPYLMNADYPGSCFTLWLPG